MTRFVLDASVALRWFLSDPLPPYAQHVRNLFLRGSHAVVPALWHLEMANGLSVAYRRRAITSREADQALKDIEGLLGREIELNLELATIREALTTARAYHLTAYDSVYLDLARREQLALATLDEGLRAAAGQAGVAILR